MNSSRKTNLIWWSVLVTSFIHPSTVVEAGLSESYPHLERDMRLWLEGTREVNVRSDYKVVPDSRSSSKVRGSVEAWARGANGAPTKRQSSVCVYFSLLFSSNIILMVCYVRSSCQCDLTNLTLTNEDLSLKPYERLHMENSFTGCTDAMFIHARLQRFPFVNSNDHTWIWQDWAWAGEDVAVLHLHVSVKGTSCGSALWEKDGMRKKRILLTLACQLMN